MAERSVDEVHDGQLPDRGGPHVLPFGISGDALRPPPESPGREVKDVADHLRRRIRQPARTFAACGDNRTPHGLPVTGPHRAHSSRSTEPLSSRPESMKASTAGAAATRSFQDQTTSCRGVRL